MKWHNLLHRRQAIHVLVHVVNRMQAHLPAVKANFPSRRQTLIQNIHSQTLVLQSQEQARTKDRSKKCIIKQYKVYITQLYFLK